jgi:hypothetical protein
VEVAVSLLLAEVAEGLAVFVLPDVMTSVATPPLLFVTSDTTTTVVDVLASMSLDGEGRVGRFVADKIVEEFGGVDIFRGTTKVAVVDEQTFVVLKLKFPLANSQAVRLARGARASLYAISGSVRPMKGLPANVELGVRVVPFIKGAVVPISVLFGGTDCQYLLARAGRYGVIVILMVF